MVKRRTHPLHKPPIAKSPITCLCPFCGEIVAKAAGVQCKSMKCPKCGNIMVKADKPP